MVPLLLPMLWSSWTRSDHMSFLYSVDGLINLLVLFQKLPGWLRQMYPRKKFPFLRWRQVERECFSHESKQLRKQVTRLGSLSRVTS